MYGNCLIFQASISYLFIISYELIVKILIFKGKAIMMVFKNCVAIALIVSGVGYLGLLLLNNLEVILNVFKLFTI